MGKIKRSRQKVHNAAVKERKQQKEQDVTVQDVTVQNETDKGLTCPQANWDVKSDIFKSMKIDPALLQQILPDFDSKSAVTSKTLKEFNINKKTKLKLRHELWMQKVDAVTTSRKKDREKKNREQIPIVGDMRPLQECLPTLELLMKNSCQPLQPSLPKSKAVVKEKQRKKQQLQDHATFVQVTHHAAFKEKPLATIKEHLANKLKLEGQMDMD